MNIYKWTLNNIDTGDRVVLDKDPYGWKDLTVTHQRDEKWHGVFYNFSSELGFYCDGGGREFVEDAYDNKGAEANVTIQVDYLCNGTYTNIFTGKLNFANYRIANEDGLDGVYVNVESNDISAILRNREDAEIDLIAGTTIDGSTVNPYNYLNYDLNLHSKVIRLESELSLEEHSCCQQFATNGLKEIYIIPNTEIIKGDFERTTKTESRCVHDATFNGFLEDAPSVINTADSNIFIQQNTVTVEWNVSGQMTFNSFDVTTIDPCASNCGTGAVASKLFDSIQPRLRIFYGYDRNTSIAESCANPSIQDGSIQYIDIVSISSFVNPGNGVPKLFSASGSEQILLNPGDKVWAYWVIDLNYLSANGDLRIDFEYTDSTFKLTSNTIADSTNAKSIAIHEAWSRLSENILNQTDYAFYSELFGRVNSEPITYEDNGCGSFTAITNGINIRRQASSIFVSLADLFKTCDAIWGVGLGVETYLSNYVVRVETLDYFYQNTVILDISDAPFVQMRFAEEYVYNELDTGFDKWESEVVNGRDEPLTNASYLIDNIKNVKNTLDKTCPYIASMYAIETTRRFIEDTKDWRYDDDNFIIALARNTFPGNTPFRLHLAERNENFANISGIIDDATAYNLRFMLTNNISRWFNILSTGLTKLGTSTLKLLKYEGNKDVSYRVLDDCPGNHANTQVSSMQDMVYPNPVEDDAPIWLPEEYTFEYPVSFNDFLTIKSNPYGLVKFGTNLYGWIKNFEYQVAKGSGRFTLIRKY